MSREEFAGGMIVGAVGVSILSVLLGAAMWSISSKQVEEEWQKQCVMHGVADYYKAEGGGVEWRWNDE